MPDKPSYKIIATPGLVTIRFRDGTELKMSPQYAGKLAVGIDLAAINAEKKGRKKCEVASKWSTVPPRQMTPRPDMDEAKQYLDECPPEGTYKFKEVVENGVKRTQVNLIRRPDMDDVNDKLAAARSDEIRKGWDVRMQEAEAYNEERLGGRNALNAAIVAGHVPAIGLDPASGKDETVITERTRENEIRVIHDSVDGKVPMRKRIQDISGLAAKRDLRSDDEIWPASKDLWPSAEAMGMKRVDIDLKKAETDAMENAIAADCPLTDG